MEQALETAQCYCVQCMNLYVKRKQKKGELEE
jgi:hypothetical protein